MVNFLECVERDVDSSKGRVGPLEWMEEIASRYRLQCLTGDWHGARLCSWAVGDIHALDIHIERGAMQRTTLSEASASPLILKLVLHGAVELRQGSQNVNLGAGSLLLLDPDIPFSEVFLQPTHMAVFWLPRERLRERGLPFRLQGLVVPEMGTPESMAMRDQVLSILRRSPLSMPDLGARMGQHLLDMMDIMIGHHRGNRSTEALVHKAKLYLIRHLGDAEIDASSIGRALGLSSNYLNRLFRREGKTMMSWLWSQRLEHAAQLLTSCAQGELRVSEIAYRCGFSDAAHFSRSFRASFGTTPSECRPRSAHVSVKRTAFLEQR